MNTISGKNQRKLIAYVDGFNLYFGLKSKGWNRFYWLNLVTLVKSCLKPDQTLVGVKYFTATVYGNAQKEKRQRTYLEALQTLPNFNIYYGHFLRTSRKCSNCGYNNYTPSEKMTDVNISVEMLTDAFQNRFDMAMLISADSDLVGPIRTITSLFPDKRVIAAFPPGRSSKAMMKVASAYFSLGRAKIAQNQFPDQIKKSDGYTLRRPKEWR